MPAQRQQTGDLGHASSSPIRPPGPRENLLLGSFLELRRVGLVQFFEQCWREHGDLVRFRVGPYVGHIVVHPDHVRQVLVERRHNYGKGRGYAKTRAFLGDGLLTSEGDRWQRQRRRMQPPFTARGVTQFAADIGAAVATMTRGWDGAATIDVEREMMHLTLSIIGRAMFGTDMAEAGATMVEAIGEACDFINVSLASFIELPLWLPTAANRRFTAALRALDGIIADILAARRAQPDGHDDLLGKLLTARGEGGEPMSDRQIRDEIITIFFAGHDTSAGALTWAWYLLARDPEADERLYNELHAQLGEREPTVADLPHLPFTRAVVDETLRLYPSVWTFPREAIADDELGGHHIPAGSQIFPCQYLSHRHPAFWDQPERFMPGRFADPGGDGPHNPAYFPFGGGPRTCIGNHLALQELTLVIASVARRYRLRATDPRPIDPVSSVTLHPSRPIHMTVTPRDT